MYIIPTYHFSQNSNARLIETLINRHLKQSGYSVQWNANQYSSGVYLYRLESNRLQQIKKCILLK